MSVSLIQYADSKMKCLLEIVENVAGSKASVLIQGESGTGKELLARYVHAKSARSGKPFFAINCAALPEGLLESELFGYERGSFTGAEKRQGHTFSSDPTLSGSVMRAFKMHNASSRNTVLFQSFCPGSSPW